MPYLSSKKTADNMLCRKATNMEEEVSYITQSPAERQSKVFHCDLGSSGFQRFLKEYKIH